MLKYYKNLTVAGIRLSSSVAKPEKALSSVPYINIICHLAKVNVTFPTFSSQFYTLFLPFKPFTILGQSNARVNSVNIVLTVF
jgi:hypothetical protein